MVAAYCGSVAIAGYHYHVKLGIGHLFARGKRKRAPVSGVQRVKIHVSGGAGGAADAGYDNGLVPVEPKLVYGADYVTHNDAVAAAGAPDMGHVGLPEIICYVSHFEITAIVSL